MILSKFRQSIVIFSRNSKLAFKKYSSRFFNNRTTLAIPETRLCATNAIFASVAAIGLSLYIANQRGTFCESVQVIENNDLNFPADHHTYDEAIAKSRDLLQRVKDECGAPGMVVGVSVNGKTIWSEGLGYSDIENRVLCSPDTVMRIASISKSITMTVVGKLWEQGKLDLDKPVQHYVPYFPEKSFDKKPVTITCRQLVSHLGGIRHYFKVPPAKSTPGKKTEAANEKSKKNGQSDHESKEFYIKDHFKDVKSSLDLFKDDALIVNPGSKFYYSTHGWTLISAIVESAAKEPFSTHVTKLFKSLGMSNTYLDVNDALIYYRSRNYIKDKNGRLINAPYVDNSYKWAGGGFLSTVGDLLKFGNAMLYSFQYSHVVLPVDTEKGGLENEQNIKNSEEDTFQNVSDKETKISNKQICPGYLNSKTVQAMWTPVVDVKEEKYGMGWFISPDVKECQFCESKVSVFHTGGAVGGSSVLFILPQSGKDTSNLNSAPEGIIVAILTNLESVTLHKTALKIAQLFDQESKCCL